MPAAPTTNIVNSTEWWAQPDKGIEGFDSTMNKQPCSSSSYPRTAGDSFTVWSSNSEPAKSLISTQPQGTCWRVTTHMYWKVNVNTTASHQRAI
jgi:hypothetical protein